MELSINRIKEITNGELSGPADGTINQILIDSRGYCTPGKTAFFALHGPHNNGHDFIDQLYSKGVRCFVVSSIPEDKSIFNKTSFILVENTLVALQSIAIYCRSEFNKPLIGITGSNGKTIIKEWLTQILSGSKKVIRSPKSFNSQVGVPLSLWRLDNDFDLAIIEAGISLPGEMKNLEKMIKPDIGIMTNIGEAHQENFKNFEEKIEEKLDLFKESSILLYCKDHKSIDEIIKNRFRRKNKKLFSWSQKEEADLTVQKVETIENNTQIITLYNGITESITIPFTDKASIENAIHALLLLKVLDYPHEKISKGMKELEPVAMRLELKKGINDCILINDTYNSDIASLEIALDFLKQQQLHKKTLILSDIFQSGMADNKLYAKVAEMVQKREIIKFIGIGEALFTNAEKFHGNKRFYKTTDEFLKYFSRNHFNNEVVLLKGSRDFEFEKISDQLEFQAHETVLEVNLGSLINNLNYFRKKLHPKTSIMVMVKAFSYGSGSYEIANLLQYQRIDYLAVAFTDEGVTLREKGIGMPIMVMNPDSQNLLNITRYSLEPEIYNKTILHSFQEHVKKTGTGPYPIHIKVDTGMNRLGFIVSEVESLLDELKKIKEFEVKSVFTHLVGSENPDLDGYTLKQIKLFNQICNKFSLAFPYNIKFHILNSAGIERFPQAQLDMVRLGIGLHGISFSENATLINTSTFRSIISQIRIVNTGESIGYGRKAIAKKEMRIAIIPVGYADGLNRKLGNGNWSFYLNGTLVPIVGDICMDMCMIDISETPASEGDPVEIFGNNVTVNQMAKVLGTIPYEILTNVSSRVRRIYIQE